MKRTRKLLSLALCLMMALPYASSAVQTDTKLSPELITYELMAYEHASQPWLQDAVVLQEITDRTNVNIKINAVPLSDHTAKLNVLLSTNQMPDIVKTAVNGNEIKTYASSGIFLNLSEYMEEYAPNYYALYQADPNISMYDYDGNTYGFVVLADKSNAPNAPGLVLRHDLLEKNNLPLPATTEELLESMIKLKELYPESQPWTSRGSTEALLNRSSYMLGAGFNMYYEPQIGAWTYGQATENFKVILNYLNRAYKAGVLDVDYATMNNQLWQEKMNTGKSFMYIENPGFSRGMTANLRATDPDALLTMAPIPANSVTNSARALRYPSPEDSFFIISADVENPEVIVSLFDYLYSDEGAVLTNFGIEGLSFFYDENGSPQFIPEYAMQFANEASPSYAIMSALGSGQLGLAPRFMNTHMETSLNNALGLKEDLVLKHINESLNTDPAFEAAVINPPLTEDENEIVTDILSRAKTYLLTEYDQFIIGEKSVDQWDDVIAQLQSMDIQKVIDIYNTAYNRALGK